MADNLSVRVVIVLTIVDGIANVKVEVGENGDEFFVPVSDIKEGSILKSLLDAAEVPQLKDNNS